MKKEPTWTLNRAAQVWRIDRRTLEKRLSAAGFTGPRYTTQQVVDATYGEAARIAEREAAANATMAELRAKSMAEEFVDFAAVQKIIGEIFLSYRQRLLSLPSEVCAKANPADPAFANAALQEWVDNSLRMLRGEIAKIDARGK